MLLRCLSSLRSTKSLRPYDSSLRFPSSLRFLRSSPSLSIMSSSRSLKLQKFSGTQTEKDKTIRPKWPAKTDSKECHQRDKVLSDYVRGRDWFMSYEFNLLRKLTITPDVVPGWKLYRDQYPLLFDLEWECSRDIGRGDLVCTDGNNNFLIAELKSLATCGNGSKGKKRRHGKQQTIKYATFWDENNPQVRHTVGVCGTEEEAVQ